MNPFGSNTTDTIAATLFVAGGLVAAGTCFHRDGRRLGPRFLADLPPLFLLGGVVLGVSAPAAVVAIVRR